MCGETAFVAFPSCILPRMTGEEKIREEKKEAQRLP
jgi:hypothetical protein